MGGLPGPGGDPGNHGTGHPLRTIYFHLTSECNLACRHCWVAPRLQRAATASEFLSLPLLRSIVGQALPLGLASVKLTGGEPLLHPDFSGVLAVAREHDLGVAVETNGTLVTRDHAEALAACRDPFVSVSLDGADADTHEWVRGVPGCFGAACRGIGHLVDAGLRPQLIMSLFRRNADQVEALVETAVAMGAGSVKFNIVQPNARGARVHADGEALTVAEVLRIGARVDNELAPRSGVPLVFSTPPAFSPLGRLFGDGGCGCGRCGIREVLGVLGDGSYALCGIGETIPALVFGHAARDRLAKVWRGHPVLEEIRAGLPRRLEGVCRACAMRGACLGGCLAQNVAQAGSLWGPYWFCSAAEEAGLFPQSRLLEWRE